MYFRISIDSLFYVFLLKKCTNKKYKKQQTKEYKTKENERTNVQINMNNEK